MSDVLRVLSLGAGVQSTAVLLMAHEGEFEHPPDCAIFADTQWEPPEVYTLLDWLDENISIPIHRVTAGSLRDAELNAEMRARKASGKRYISMPFRTLNKDNQPSLVRRQCTREFKIDPIQREIRRLLGYKKRQRIPENSAEMWIGISADEVMRMKPSRVKWITHIFPLLFERRMTRRECKVWLEAHGYAIPQKSACVCCPYRNNTEWREIKEDPALWKDATEFDREMRNHGGPQGALYVHQDCVPLDEVDLRDAEGRGQLNLFINECEGMCGV